ncbi:MAG: MoaD/ThiS family protein [Pirellulales bacterium]
MATVYFPPLLRDATGGTTHCQASGDTLRKVIAATEAQFPELAGRLRRGDALAPGVAASIDGSFAASLLDPVGEESEVHFLPAVGGG